MGCTTGLATLAMSLLLATIGSFCFSFFSFQELDVSDLSWRREDAELALPKCMHDYLYN